jgi:hypothetical protein
VVAAVAVTSGGKLTSNGGEALAHIRTSDDVPACDVQLIFTPADARAEPRGARFAPALSVGHSYWTPKSRGSVLIRSADPVVPPVIQLNMLTEPIASTVERELLPGNGADIGMDQESHENHQPSGVQRCDGT